MTRQGYKFVGGTAETGRIVLERGDGSTEQLPDVVIVRASLTDNEDSTFDVTFDGS